MEEIRETIRAAVDIGSNTVQMLAGYRRGGRIVPVERYLAMTRLGKSPRANFLTEQAVGDTVAALREIKKITDAAGIDEVLLLATSAVRDAENRSELQDAVRSACGWEIRVLRGEEEAALSYRGACSAAARAGALVLDIGGSSTELIAEEGSAVRAVSYNIGAVRMKNHNWQREDIRRIFASAPLPPFSDGGLIGVGGTVTTAAIIASGAAEYSREAVQGRVLSREWLAALREDLAALPLEARCAFSPFLAQRGEIIVEGLTILDELMSLLGADELIASDTGFLDGALLG